MNKSTLAVYIDHTVLKADATESDIIRICREALEHKFASVCINPSYVKLAHSLLDDTDVKVCTVVGFPLGATTPEVKAFEAAQAIKNGATEVDMVLNIGALKSGKLDLVLEDIQAVVEACKDKALLKVIHENCLLTEAEKITACELSKRAGADYVKTSTGFSASGATAEDVALMRKCVGEDIGVKAAGGIRSLDTALKMIEAGASRIGASASINILNELNE